MNKRNIFLSFLIIFILTLGFLFWTQKSESVEAGSTENVYGWAYSENIGWISFNCDNYYGNDPSNRVDRCGANNYGVHIDPSNGNLSGYAWSENIGWIYFGPNAPYPNSNNPNYSACIKLPGKAGNCSGLSNDYDVAGWARAYRAIETDGQTLGGWDGWIKLKGIAQNGSPYGVSIDTTPNPDEFEGWAWGGGGITKDNAVVGWISFNNKNCQNNIDCTCPSIGGVSCPNLSYPCNNSCADLKDYKVMTGLGTSVTDPSYAFAIDFERHCETCGVSSYILKYTTGDTIPTGYKIKLKISSVNYTNYTTTNPFDAEQNHSYRLNISYSNVSNPIFGDDIYIEVFNEGGSVISNTLMIPAKNHAHPCVDFTPKPPASLIVNPGENQFCSIKDSICPKDLAYCYDNTDSTNAIGDPSYCSTSGWAWDTPDGLITDENFILILSETYTEVPVVSLEVTDLTNQSCDKEYTYGLKLRAPEWKEIRP